MAAVDEGNGLAIAVNHRPELIEKLHDQKRFVIPMGSIHTASGKLKNMKSVLWMVDWFSSGGKRKIAYKLQDDDGNWKKAGIDENNKLHIIE